MADTVPGYMRPTSAATNRRATLGKVATNQPRPLKPSAASSGKAGLASSKPLGASGVSDSGSAALGSSSGPGQPKDILKAKELVLDAKAAETTGKLQEALLLYRQAIKLLPASHLPKLRGRINAVRDALKLQTAAAAAVKAAAAKDAAPAPAAAPARAVPAHLANIGPRRPDDAAEASAPASASPAAEAAPEAEPAPAPPADACEDAAEDPDAGADGEEGKSGSELAHCGDSEEQAEREEKDAEAPAAGRKLSLAAAVPSTGDVVTDSLVAMLNTASVDGLLELPNIGKKRAANIVAAREEGGPFATPADLSRIGLSDKQSDKLCAAYAEAVAEGRLALAAAKARKSL
ncbi:hypothetical protein FNF29_00420 [Cafeteria roenbergensis]|uniref:Uncharacterized protein n=1 Tax=Cafeteria roenbergensis TaxID=33653 RepID=A0A5A8CWF3_CAFRO|nr:hypothetical protein FNF29_00420 [Cafeteria roenbergensis]|eukprot:KAA0157068.1 hypothetical protein FNF29_00420 [Cafeteria roenbergensis]